MLILGVMLAGALFGCILGYFIGQSIGFDRGVALAEQTETILEQYNADLLDDLFWVKVRFSSDESYYEGKVAFKLLTLLHNYVDLNNEDELSAADVVTAFKEEFPTIDQFKTGVSNDTIE